MANAVALVDDLRPPAEGEDQQLVLDPKAFPFQPLRALAAEGALTAVGLDLDSGPELSYDRYAQLGTYLGIMNRACMWWIGDWLIYGEGRFGDRFEQTLAVTGLAEQTLINRMSVCRSIPAAERRVSVSFSMHADLQGLTARDRRYWLDRAEKNGWTRAQLRDAMKAKQEKDHAGAGEQTALPAGHVDKQAVVEAAQRVVSARQDYGADWLVPREAMAQLVAALGEEE